MGGQDIIVVLTVAFAAAFVVRSVWKSLAAKGCSSGCGKCAAEPAEANPKRKSLL